MEEAKEEDVKVECPERNRVGSVCDLSIEFGYINIECPCCGKSGRFPEGHDGDDWDSEPPAPAAPAPALVISYRCAICRDTGRVVKPSAWFAGRSMLGFCPDCTPHYDFATRRFVNCGGTGDRAGEEPPLPAAARFDRATHCQRIGRTGGLEIVERHGRAHLVAIGKAGHAAAVAAHGVAHGNGLPKAKRWADLRRPDPVADLAAGRALADLDRAA